MKEKILFISLFVLSCLFVPAQKILTKEEILQDHKTSHIKNKLPKDSIKLTWSDELNIKLRSRIVSLKSSGIDSLVVYSVSYPGYSYKIDSCSSTYSTVAYLIWKQQGQVTIEKFKGQCQFVNGNDNPKEIFTFYNSHYNQLRDEMFMPIIYNGKIYDSSRVTYEGSVTFHEPQYSLYYEIDSSYNFFSFGESEIDDKKSIFYDYNLKLEVYHWWKMISEQVRK